jgi:hypothetical protein
MNNNFVTMAIKNNFLNEDFSYVNATLQSLSSLDCIIFWIKELIKNNNIIMNNLQASLTKEFYLLIFGLYSGQLVDSTKIIFHFRNKSQQIYNKDIAKDPFHFLYYLLELLHLENNCPINPNYNIDLYKNQIFQNKTNDNEIYKLFCNYYQQTTNSAISQYFYNIEKYQINCQFCHTIYYYAFKTIFRFEIDKYRIYRDKSCPMRKGYNLNLNECFFYYQEGKQCQCTFCGNQNATDMRKIFTSTQVIIIDLKRNNHTYKCDIDFDLQIDLLADNYIIPHSKLPKFNTKYNLKAVVSLYNNGKPKYSSYISINNNWYRYMDLKNKNGVKRLQNICELREHEPQLLIYELENTQKNFLNPFYNRINKGNNNIFSMQQLFLMQMKQMLIKQQLFQKMQQNLMYQNININPYIKKNNNDNLTIEFLVIPENYNSLNKDENIIRLHVKSEDTIEKVIDNFFNKLEKPKEAIEEFKFNGNVIDIKSQVKLKDFGITNDSKIYATKAPDFDHLNLSKSSFCFLF